MHHRQLLDFVAKGNFTKLDPNAAYEILEGILGVPPPKKVPSLTQEGLQILDKLSDLHKHLVELQKYNELLNILVET